MEGTNRLYPPIEPYELEPPQVVSAAATGGEEAGVCDWPVMWDEEPEASPSRQEAPHIFETETKDHPPINFEEGSLDVVNAYEFSNAMTMIKETGEDIYSKSPLRKQTGIWVPASVPPMTKHDHDEWKKGFGYNSSCFEEEYNWDIDEENWEMTMWDVLTEIFVAGKDKILSVASYDFERHGLSLVSQFFLEEALKDKSETLEDTCSGPEHALLETEPAKWLPDSAASSCMLCGARFHPIICTRHHCRFCGGIFCGGCSKGRSLLPPKFTFWLFKGSKLAVFVVGYFVVGYFAVYPHRSSFFSLIVLFTSSVSVKMK